MPQDLVDAPPVVIPTLDHLIAHDAQVLSTQLTSIRQRLFPPAAQKTLRHFSSGEAARLIGISDAYLRQLSLAGEAPEPDKTPTGGRFRARRAENTCHVARELNTCRSSPSPTSRVVQGRRRPPHICHSIWRSAGTGYSRSTWTRSPACPRSLGISRKPTWGKTRPSTAPCDMMT